MQAQAVEQCGGKRRESLSIQTRAGGGREEVRKREIRIGRRGTHRVIHNESTATKQSVDCVRQCGDNETLRRGR